MNRAIKAGARHSQVDQQDIQAAHDALVRAGALCSAKAWTPPLAIKSVGGGRVEGLLVRYTDPHRLDLGRDYFDAGTDLCVKDGDELPLLWHHNLDPEKRGPIGKGTVKFTDAGLWFQSWLNRRDQYEMLILKMIELGKAGYSSGADTPRVLRQPIAGKANAHRIARWPLIEGSVTPVPMDAANTVSIKAFMAQQRQPDFWSDVQHAYGVKFASNLKRQFAIEDELDLLDLEIELDKLERG